MLPPHGDLTPLPRASHFRGLSRCSVVALSLKLRENRTKTITWSAIAVQVSGNGGDNQSDGGDVWQLDADGRGEWKQNIKVRLRHVDTGVYLHSHDRHRYSHPISGQQEVCAVKRKDANSNWLAAEGVYFVPQAAVGGAKDEL